MTLNTTLKATAAAACVLAFAGCTDLKPIQAQVDDLKSQVSKLQSDTAKASSDAAAASSAAASASSAALRRAEHGEPGVVDGSVQFDGHRSDQREDRSHVQEVSVEVNLEHLMRTLNAAGSTRGVFLCAGCYRATIDIY